MQRQGMKAAVNLFEDYGAAAVSAPAVWFPALSSGLSRAALAARHWPLQLSVCQLKSKAALINSYITVNGLPGSDDGPGY